MKTKSESERIGTTKIRRRHLLPPSLSPRGAGCWVANVMHTYVFTIGYTTFKSSTSQPSGAFRNPQVVSPGWISSGFTHSNSSGSTLRKSSRLIADWKMSGLGGVFVVLLDMAEVVVWPPRSVCYK